VDKFKKKMERENETLSYYLHFKTQTEN